MTLFELPSTEDHIGVKQAITDNDQCEHLLETSKFNLALMYPSVSIFLFFFVDSSSNFPLNLRTAAANPRSSSSPSDIRLQSVVLSISISATSPQTLPQPKARLLSAHSSLGAPNSRAETLGPSELAILFHVLLFSMGGLSFPAMAPNYMNTVWLHIGHNLHEYSAADSPP